MNSDNQQDQNTGGKYERADAYQSLEMINSWISNIDTKVSFALALTGVLIGFIFSTGLPSALKRVSEVTKLAELSGGEIIGAILVCLLYIVSFISILCFMLAIISRVKNMNNALSIFFFGSISGMELQNYKDRANQITEKEIIEDLEEQIHTNSRICSQKAKWYNKGIKFLVVTIALWFVCMTFRLI